jgi:isoleucyl-tRNA synthetase
VLDILHLCLTAWLAPALPFTAEEAYCARHGDDASVHLTLFPEIPAHWRNDALAEKWGKIREIRTSVTGAIEAMRREKTIGSSLQAIALLPASASALLTAQDWADISITSNVEFGEAAGATEAPGGKCERCWRVLPEVGASLAHPSLCLRCCEAIG